jgi:chromosome segregation ATPase
MQHEPCSSHDAICAVLTAIRESVREMRDDVKSVHAGTEAVNRVLERHIERQDALEAVLAESIRDLRQGFSEYREEHNAIVTELERHADVLEQVNINSKAVTNGGLTRALESALPAVLQAVGVREQAKMTMWQNLGVALIGAIGGGILAWVSKQ